MQAHRPTPAPPLSPPPSRDYQPPDRLTRIEMVLWGLDGTNGLRGQVKGHEADIEEIKAWRARVETVLRISSIATRWGGIAIIFAVATFGSDATVARVEWALKQLKMFGG